jgi:hypothetical protein
MMKWLFWLLLLVSLAFFALIQWSGMLLGDGKNLQPQPSLNTEKIKLLQAPPASPTAAQSAVQTADSCMEWSEFSGNDLARASAAMDALKLGDRLTQRRVEHISSYWVYIPPLKTNLDADKKVSQLKSLGVEEYFVVQEPGKWRNAISLGVFKTEEATHKFLEHIHVRGVKSAMAGERLSKFTLTIFVLKNPDTETVAKVAALQNEFAGSELKAAACENVSNKQ